MNPAAAIILFAAIAGAAPSSRVVFCTQRAGACAQLTALGQLDGGFWAFAPDAALSDGTVELLYLHREEYERLPAKVLQDVLRERRKRSSRFADRAPELGGAALRRILAGPRFHELLGDIAALEGWRRYEGALPESVLVTVLEAQAQLLAELEDAHWPTGQIEKHRALARETQSLLARSGNKTYAEQLPQVDLERVFAIRPLDRRLLQQLTAAKEPVLDRKDELIAPWKLRKLDSLQRGHTLRIVYFSRSRWSSDLAELPRAELELRLAPPERAEHLADLAITEAVLELNLAVLAEQQRVPWADAARAHARASEALLPELLGPRTGEGEASADLELLAVLSERAHRPELAALLRALAAHGRSDR